MRYLKTLTFLFCVLFGVEALAQSSPQTFSRIRDGALPNNLANVYQFQITFPTTYYGLFTASGTYYYDGDSATFRRWWGKTAGADAITNATPFPWVGNFNYALHGLTWDRMTLSTSSDGALSATPQGLDTIDYTHFFNGTRFQRWTGEAVDDSMTAAPVSPFVASYGVFGSLDLAISRRITGEAWDDNMAGAANPNSNSFGVYYDAANAFARRWRGESWDDSIGLVDNAPSVIGLSTFYDGDSTVGYRWNGLVMDDAMPSGPTAPYTISLGSFFNGVNFQRWTGEAYDASMTAAPTSPNINSFGVFWDSTNSINRRWLGETLDGSNTAPITAPYVGAITYGLDATGLIYYPLKTDANGLFIHIADLQPGDDAVNDYKKIKVQAVNPYSPTATTTAAVDVTGTIAILSSLEILGYSQYTINVKNTGGVNTVDYVVLYASPNGTDWTILDTYNTDIAPGGIARVVSVINNADRYIKVLAATVANTTSVDCYVTGRVSN